jgi:hypothetical protein
MTSRDERIVENPPARTASPIDIFPCPGCREPLFLDDETRLVRCTSCRRCWNTTACFRRAIESIVRAGDRIELVVGHNQIDQTLPSLLAFSIAMGKGVLVVAALMTAFIGVTTETRIYLWLPIASFFATLFVGAELLWRRVQRILPTEFSSTPSAIFHSSGIAYVDRQTEPFHLPWPAIVDVSWLPDPNATLCRIAITYRTSDSVALLQVLCGSGSEEVGRAFELMQAHLAAVSPTVSPG